MKKKILGLVILTLVFSLIGTFAFAKEFPDVESTHWAHEFISSLSDDGVINGYEDGTFQPNGTITNGEFIKLVVAACLPPYITVDDLEGGINHWAGPYIRMAEQYSLVDMAEYTIENVNEPMTRIEMVRLISNADIIMLQHKSQFSQQVDFEDVANLPLKDVYKLSHAVARGLVKGYEDGTFKPEGKMTRAEAATMIYRFYQSKGE